MTPTTARNIRIPDGLWAAALAKAAARDETVAQVVRRALREYVEGER